MLLLLSREMLYCVVVGWYIASVNDAADRFNKLLAEYVFKQELGTAESSLENMRLFVKTTSAPISFTLVGQRLTNVGHCTYIDAPLGTRVTQSSSSYYP